MTGVADELQPWTRISERQGEPGATWAVGILNPRMVLAGGREPTVAQARQILEEACRRLRAQLG